LLSVITSCALSGIDAYPVTVEVDIASGLPGFTMVGLPDSAVKEARERVFAAIKNSGFSIPSKRITVNLAPGGIKKEGTAFDLPLAMGILMASEQIGSGSLSGLLFMGELSLDGTVRPVRGVLSAAIYAKGNGLKGIIIPRENRAEADQVNGIGIFSTGNLIEALEFIKSPVFSKAPTTKVVVQRTNGDKPVNPSNLFPEQLDFSDVRGQTMAKRALEVAAAGGHNFLLVGSPGCGKTLLARRMPSILPPLSNEESLETTRIYSVAGLLKAGTGRLHERPFRAPHHSISHQALVGGGGWSRPGEVSLAHNGVLFLDEFPEFHKDAIEGLRQPLEEGTITISRTSGSLTYPCRSMLGAAMNPCPCGYLLDRKRRCLCRMEEIVRYRARISGPMLDRIDIHLELPVLGVQELEGPSQGESSTSIRARVESARKIQRRRFERGLSGSQEGIFCNGHMSGVQAREFCILEVGAKKLLRTAVETLGFSARAYDRILKVGRTIADLEASEEIKESHIGEAIHYRCLDRELQMS
jgi:magnesium chelatase family protein